MLLGYRTGLFQGLNLVKVHSGIPLDRFGHGDALKGLVQIQLHALIGQLSTAGHLLGHGTNQLFGQVHHAVNVGVSLVQLQHCLLYTSRCV